MRAAAGICSDGVSTGVQLAQPGYHHSIFRSRAMWPAHASIGVKRVLMTEQEQTYDDGRARNLEALLRALADRIRELDGQGKLLDQAGELMRLIGDVRSELFHYEVRITYDTPEVAENRRIVREAEETSTDTWQTSEWKPDEDESPEW
jgi:adenylate cyclase class IV